MSLSNRYMLYKFFSLDNIDTIDKMKNILQLKRDNILAGETCDFHGPKTIGFMQLTCKDEEIKEAFDQVIGDRGYRVSFIYT